MVKNNNQHDIHAVKVDVITDSKRLYKNNKLVKEYTIYSGVYGAGYTIYLMPGKSYLLSDGFFKKEIVTVEENTPLTVSLR